MSVPSAEALAAKITKDEQGNVYGPNGTPMGTAAKSTDKPKRKPAAKTGDKSPTEMKTPVKTKNGDKVSRARVVESDLTPVQRRLVVVKAMRKIGATTAATSITATALAAKCGMSRFEVYGALYHTHPLQVQGFVKQVKLEDNRENSYHLTAKGIKSDPE